MLSHQLLDLPWHLRRDKTQRRDEAVDESTWTPRQAQRFPSSWAFLFGLSMKPLCYLVSPTVDRRLEKPNGRYPIRLYRRSKPILFYGLVRDTVKRDCWEQVRSVSGRIPCQFTLPHIVGRFLSAPFSATRVRLTSDYPRHSIESSAGADVTRPRRTVYSISAA